LVKEFLYRGIPKEELDSLSLEKLFLLFNSRQRRSLTRGITDGKRKLIEEIKAAKAGKLKNPIKTHVRDLIVLPYMVGVTVNVNTFSGKEFQPITITTEMIGHYLGEYAITNKKVSHGAPGVGASRSSLYVPLK
jgi:small subunit ribosomal protein S19